MEMNIKLRRIFNGGCPYCLEKGSAKLNGLWLPPKGFDPYLRQYDCQRCGSKFFRILTSREFKLLHESLAEVVSEQLEQ